VYVRSQYFADALPDWVGELEEGVDYRELLRNAGVSVPVDDTMELSVADPVADDSGEDNTEEEDVAQGTIPVQGSATGDVDPESETHSDTQEQSSTPISNHQQQHTETETHSDTQMHTETPSNMQTQTQRKAELPPATLKPK
jgi:hypothetical protein